MSKKVVKNGALDLLPPSTSPLKPKGLRIYNGLDCSGKNRVLPPTFKGVKDLVKQYGESVAMQMYSCPDEVDASPDESKDIVRDFLQDLTYADKVERQTLINEFNSYINDLTSSFESQQQRAQAAGRPAIEPASDNGGPAQQEPTAEE